MCVTTYDIGVPEFAHPRVDFLVKEAREIVARYFTVVELGDKEVGLVRKNGKIAGVLAPGTRQLYWRGPIDVDVEVLEHQRAVRDRSGDRGGARACKAAASRRRCRTR